MKTIALVILTVSVFASCNIRKDVAAKEKSNNTTATEFKDSTTVQVIDTVYNFGKVTDGEKVEYNFRFRNTGTKPLVVSNATASCGCTVPEKPTEPIPAGQIGTIKVVFDSKGRVGTTMKEITVTSNAYPAFPPMKLTGEVVAQK